MAIILKERTSLEEKQDRVNKKIRAINKERRKLDKKHKAGKGGIRVLMIRWKRFVVLSVNNKISIIV